MDSAYRVCPPVFNNIDNTRGEGFGSLQSPLEIKRFTVLDTYSPAVFRAQCRHMGESSDSANQER